MSEVEIQYIIVEDSESATQYLVYPPRDKAIIPAGHTVHFPAQSIAAVNLTGERLLAYLKVTDDTGKLLHYKEEYTRDYYYNDEFSTTMPPRDYSITVEAGLVGGGTPHVVTFTIHLGPNYLTVDSTPVKGIPFVIDNKQYATPTTLQLPPGTYTIAMPKTHTDPETGVTYAFDHWEDGSTNPTRTINLTADTTITATYATAPTYTLTINVNDETLGTTDPPPGTYQHPLDTTVTVTAIPKEDAVFDHWILDGAERTENPITIIMDRDHTLTAYFRTAIHNLTVDSEPIKGIPFTVDTTEASTPTTLTLREGTYTVAMPPTYVDPETGVTYAFDHWEDGSTNPTRTINLTADTTITATYTPPPETAILTGTVKGVLGTPVRNAKVTLNGFQTSTDQQGKFTITDIPLGAYTLRVEHILYETYTASIEMTTAGTYEVTIQLSLKNTIKGAAIGVVAALIISIFLARR